MQRIPSTVKRRRFNWPSRLVRFRQGGIGLSDSWLAARQTGGNVGTEPAFGESKLRSLAIRCRLGVPKQTRNSLIHSNIQTIMRICLVVTTFVTPYWCNENNGNAVRLSSANFIARAVGIHGGAFPVG